MPDREKVIKGLECCSNSQKNRCEANSCPYWVSECCCIDDMLNDALELLKEQEDLGTELTNAVELIHKKNERIEKLLKEQETKLICNLLGGQPYEVYCRECRTVLCILGKGETMNDAKRIFNYCPHCGRSVKWE